MTNSRSFVDAQRTLGNKQYEITNHLGNVLAVITDRKLPYAPYGDDPAYNGVIHTYYAQVISVTDYTAFGVSLEGRTWSRTTTPTFEMYRALEPGENISITVNGTAQLLYYSAGSNVEDYLLQMQFSLSANNISSTIDGHSLIITGYDPATMHISCSPEIGGFDGFGCGYRFGFQNQEQDDELWEGAVTFKYRVEDPRLGRFFSVDPLYKEFPWNSNYVFSENRTNDGIELEGLEFVNFTIDEICRSVIHRMFYPESIDQGNTSSCGPAAIGYMMAKHDPASYLSIVMDLYNNGKAKHPNTQFEISPDDHLFSMSTSNPEFPYSGDKGIYVADWIFNSSLRDSENDMWDYDGENSDYSAWGATLPSTMESWMSDLIGLKNVTDHGTGLMIGGSSDAQSTLGAIQKRYDQGAMEALFINANMLDGNGKNAPTSYYRQSLGCLCRRTSGNTRSK